MLLGTFAHDPLVAATELSHEVAHLYLYEKTRLGQIDDTAETQVFSPWKQTERPIYLTLHALTTYLSQSVFLARYTLDQGTMLPYVTATLGREIERLQIGARAFAEAVGSNMNSQTRDIIGAVEAFTDHAKAAC
jgi:HEXXH motif-containing protein